MWAIWTLRALFSFSLRPTENVKTPSKYHLGTVFSMLSGEDQKVAAKFRFHNITIDEFIDKLETKLFFDYNIFQGSVADWNFTTVLIVNFSLRKMVFTSHVFKKQIRGLERIQRNVSRIYFQTTNPSQTIREMINYFCHGSVIPSSTKFGAILLCEDRANLNSISFPRAFQGCAVKS